AKAVCQPTSMLTVPPSSRASPLPQGFCLTAWHRALAGFFWTITVTVTYLPPLRTLDNVAVRRLKTDHRRLAGHALLRNSPAIKVGAYHGHRINPPAFYETEHDFRF
ncbi:MAG: hypothetical protein AAAB17_19295, partial [Pseudomonas sp.]